MALEKRNFGSEIPDEQGGKKLAKSWGGFVHQLSGRPCSQK